MAFEIGSGGGGGASVDNARNRLLNNNGKSNTNITRRYSSGNGASAGGGDAMSFIAALYAQQQEAQKAARQSAYNATVDAQNRAYGAAKNDVNKTANKSLQEAYVNRMMSEKNLGQQMSAQGLNGGATESTIAGIQNNYGNSRNNIETARNDNLSNLANTYQNNLSQAAAALESGMAGDYANYVANLASMVASNPVAYSSVTQGDSASNSGMADYYKKLLQQYQSGSNGSVYNSQSNSNLVNSYLNNIGY